MTYDAIAAQVGLTRNGVFNICQRYEQRGRAGLKSGRKARRRARAGCCRQSRNARCAA
jgi:hypothetical protein